MSPVPGLVIVREPCARESWCILHVPSGRALILDMPGPANAELAAEALGDLLNWNASAPEVANVADLLLYVEPAVERIAARYWGVTLGPQAVYAW